MEQVFGVNPWYDRYMNDPAQTAFDDAKGIPITPGVGIGKEKEAVGGSVELPLTSAVKEGELPKEVAAVGVSMQPTTVSIPQSAQAIGLKPSGENVSQEPSTGNIRLPISDSEIVQGLRQDPTSSWRWLSEWCKKRLRQIGLLKK